MTVNSRRPDLSVVIPTLGKSPHLRGLLERLQKQSISFNVEVLVVANIPSQALRETVTSFGAAFPIKFEYLETGRRSVNLARNKGLDRSTGAIVLFLDDDAILNDDKFLARHFYLHSEHIEATGVGGPYKLEGPTNEWDRTYHDVAHEWLRRQRRSFSSRQSHQLLGGNMSLKRDHLFENSWRFDEAITFGGAESGLCQRICHANRVLLFFEDLEIGHAPQLNALLFCKKAFLQGAGARWRQRNLPLPTSVFVNEYLPIKPSNKDYRRKLYRLCFEFGSAKDPFSNRRSQSRNAIETPKFNPARLLMFRLGRMSPWLRLKSLNRAFYAALRSAWLNAQFESKKSD